MKKILIMNIGTELGGIERSLIDFLDVLAKDDNYQIDLALWKKRGPLFDEIPKKINVIENLGIGCFSDIMKIKGFNKIAKFCKYIIFKFMKLFGNEYKVLPKIKEKYDIAISYCHNGYSPYFVIDKVNADIKYMWYHHGSYDKSKKEKNKDTKYYGKYDKIITVSNSNKEMLNKHFPYINIEVISNFINEKKILELANYHIDIFNNFKGLKIVTVGRVSKEKGQLFSLEVARKLKELNIDFKWYFVGDGEEKEKCVNVVKQYEMEDYCFFIGSKANPYPYIKQADIYVQTSFVEAQPTTIREALVLKKIIIATNILPIKEAMKNYKGILCDLKPELFADAIIYVLNAKLDINNNLNEDDNVNSINADTLDKIKQLFNIEKH